MRQQIRGPGPWHPFEVYNTSFVSLGGEEYDKLGRNLAPNRSCYYSVLPSYHYAFFAYSTTVSIVLIVASAYLHYCYKRLGKNQARSTLSHSLPSGG